MFCAQEQRLPCSLQEGPMLEQLVKDCNPWEGKKTEDNRAAEENCQQVTTAPIPHPICKGGRGVGNEGLKLSLGRSGREMMF